MNLNFGYIFLPVLDWYRILYTSDWFWYIGIPYENFEIGKQWYWKYFDTMVL
jgi:hypothetical protein